jgi:DNA modification methylase
MTDFPWRNYTKNELFQEYNKLRDKKIIQKFPFFYSRLGLKCSNYFFQYERLNTPSQGKISCVEFWNKNKDKIIKYNNQKHIKNDLFSNIVFMNHAPSQFCVLIAMQIYKYFQPSKILDPFAGWGDRCLAAMAMDIDYIGIDSNPNLENAYKEMINFYPTKSEVEIIHDYCENINLSKINFDFVFSSPPYWNKKHQILEKYNKCNENYNIFLNKVLIPFITKCLKKNSNIWICLNMPEHMYKDIAKNIGECKKILYFNSGSNTNSKNNGKNNNIIYCY